MTRCMTPRGKKKRTCIGQRDKEITIKAQQITPPGDVNYGNIFTATVIVSARIETITGKSVFDEVANREIDLTHLFDIPYLDGVSITSEDWVEYRGNNYRILSVENVDEKNIDLFLRATFKGPADIPANQA